MNAPPALSVSNGHLRVEHAGIELTHSLHFLRSHCACPKCKSESGQRLIGRNGLNFELLRAEALGERPELRLVWSDGHASSFALAWLFESAAGRGRMLPFGMASRRTLSLARRKWR